MSCINVACGGDTVIPEDDEKGTYKRMEMKHFLAFPH